jgi:hypothetical protein
VRRRGANGAALLAAPALPDDPSTSRTELATDAGGVERLRLAATALRTPALRRFFLPGTGGMNPGAWWQASLTFRPITGA